MSNGEDMLLPYVEAGILRVDPDGTIWRCKIRRVGRGWSRWDDQKPTRAESGPLVKVTGGHGLRLQAIATRLVWRVYRGPIPSGMNVHHYDFDTSNRSVDNLFLSKGGVPLDYGQRLLDVCEHRHEAMILRALLEHGTQTDAAEVLGVASATISKLVAKLRRRIDALPEEETR